MRTLAFRAGYSSSYSLMHTPELLRRCPIPSRLRPCDGAAAGTEPRGTSGGASIEDVGLNSAAEILLVAAAVLQGIAVGYGLFLLRRLRGAAAAWSFLLGAMLSMLVWRVVVVAGIEPPPFFNPLIGIWGSTCMVAAMFFFGREVSGRQRAESERDALLESERAARSDAERASRLKDEFLATLSHELRTPLTAILGWTEVANRTGDARETQRALETIERNARVQSRLVDDLLDVTRMQAGSLHLELARFPLEAPVRAALQSVRPLADEKGIAIAVETEPEGPVVRADQSRLQQVASNLLVNAVKFTPRGGTIRVRVTTDDGRALLEVSDSGEGIDAEFLPQMFTRFRQGDSSTTRRHGGIGLGLSIAASLTRLHGGEISASSPGRGRGATFRVWLPLVTGDGGRHPPAAPGGLPGMVLANALDGIRIVVIDDEADVRSAVSRVLEQSGASVVALESGATISDLLARGDVDLLLLDIGMPDEDGYQLIRRIRKLPAAAGGAVPAISLTAHARSEDRARALGSGFQDHLPKPIDVPALIAAIRAVVHDSRDAGAAT